MEKEKTKKKIILGIDIDGTLCKEICFTEDECKDATPRWSIINQVNRLYNMGDFKIVIYSARKKELKKASIEWLDYWGVKYHRYGPKKMIFDWLVDDHTIQPDDFAAQ